MSEAGAFQPLLQALRTRGYRFITPTPATHARVVARKSEAHDLHDVLGWSLPFRRASVDAEIWDALANAEAIKADGALWKSRVRVSSLDDLLFVHSAYPTAHHDAVFFGPDSYRFAAFIRRELQRFGPVRRLVDVGAGAGVGAIVAMGCAEIGKVTLTDINAAAMRYAMENVLLAGQQMNANAGTVVEFRVGPGLDGLHEALDVVIANPPYIVDPLHRAYRDGGDALGAELSLTWAREAAAKLRRGGALLLYTGSAIVGGEDCLEASLRAALPAFDISYSEIDPDVFGEELDRPAYADVERIAVVGVVAVKR